MPSKQMKVLLKKTEPQYAEKSPLILEACALYLDDLTGNCIAQLKWKSIDDKPIKAVMIELELYDAFEERLSPVTYQYNGLSVEKGTSFGDKNGIQIKGNQINRFGVLLKAVAYQSGEIWRNESFSLFETLPTARVQQLMGKYYQQYKRELARMECESAGAFTPQKAKGLWQCGCGSWQKDGDQCIRCFARYDDLLAASDKDSLELGLKAYEKEQERKKLAEQEAEKRRIEAEEKERIRIEQEEHIAAEKKEVAKRKQRKVLILSVSGAAIVTAVILLITLVIIPKGHYDKGMQCFNSCNWDVATLEFEQAGSYGDAVKKRQEAQYQKGLELQRNKNYDEATPVFEGISSYKDASTQYQECIYQSIPIHLDANDILFAQQMLPQIAGYKDSDIYRARISKMREELLSRVAIWEYYTVVCLNKDGTVYISGDQNEEPALSVNSWRNIVQIAVGDYIYGLQEDGTILIAGNKYDSRSNFYQREDNDIREWRDIVAIAASETDVVGIKSDGTVICDRSDRDVSKWTNVARIQAGWNRIVGVTASGEVLCAGSVNYSSSLKQTGYPNVVNWCNMVDTVITEYDTYGLRYDGTVIAGKQPDRVSTWRDIIDIEGTRFSSISGDLYGLKSNGTVLSLHGVGYDWNGSYEDWTDIVALGASYRCLLGLKSDGKVLGVGEKDEMMAYRVSSWKDIIAVIAGDSMSLGIQNDGTLISTGDKEDFYNGDPIWNLYSK